MTTLFPSQGGIINLQVQYVWAAVMLFIIPLQGGIKWYKRCLCTSKHEKVIDCFKWQGKSGLHHYYARKRRLRVEKGKLNGFLPKLLLHLTYLCCQWSESFFPLRKQYNWSYPDAHAPKNKPVSPQCGDLETSLHVIRDPLGEEDEPLLVQYIKFDSS